MTIKEALHFLDTCSPSEADWRDPEWVEFISFVMLMTIHCRCGQMLINAGYAHEYPQAERWK
jgi:hypothetical protein